MKNWRKYLYEFLVIFIGVTLAFAVNKWNENRRDARSTAKILMEIRNGLKQDTKDLSQNVHGHNLGVEACTYFRKLLHASDEICPDSFKVHYYMLLRDYISIQNKSGYESLKTKGLELIEDDSLRLKIISLYDFDYEIIEKLEEEYQEMQFTASYSSFINELLVPHLLFDEAGKPELIQTPVYLSEIDKKRLLMYLWKIEYNRSFVLKYYNLVQGNIEKLIERIDRVVQ